MEDSCGDYKGIREARQFWIGHRILEWPEPDDRLILSSSGESEGAHGPLRIEHHLELFRRHSGLAQSHPRGNRGIGQEQATDVAEVNRRGFGITPIIERHEPEIGFSHLIRGSDVIGQFAYRCLPDTNKIDLFRGYDVVKLCSADGTSSAKQEDAERANDHSNRVETCRHVSHQRATA
jgi:hypothetical protein